MRTLHLKKVKVIINNQRTFYHSNGDIAYEITSNLFQTKFQLINPKGDVLYTINKTKGLKRSFHILDLKGTEFFKVSRKFFFYDRAETDVVVKSEKYHKTMVKIRGYHDFQIYMNNKIMLDISPKESINYRDIDIFDLDKEPLLLALLFAILIVKEDIDMSN